MYNPKYYAPEVADEVDFDELMEDSSVVPACCKSGCYVEPDGTCQHGCPSVLLELGMI